MPFHIQYDKVTGQIMATVDGNFTPEITDDRNQIIFDKSVETYALMVDLDKVEEGKFHEAGKDEANLLKPDPSFDIVVDDDVATPE